MADSDSLSEDLFYKLRNRFPQIQMGDENGKATTDPRQARFFNFEYEQDDEKWGKITISVVDPNSLKIYFSQSTPAPSTGLKPSLIMDNKLTNEHPWKNSWKSVPFLWR